MADQYTDYDPALDDYPTIDEIEFVRRLVEECDERYSFPAVYFTSYGDALSEATCVEDGTDFVKQVLGDLDLDAYLMLPYSCDDDYLVYVDAALATISQDLVLYSPDDFFPPLASSFRSGFCYPCERFVLVENEQAIEERFADTHIFCHHKYHRPEDDELMSAVITAYDEHIDYHVIEHFLAHDMFADVWRAHRDHGIPLRNLMIA